MAESAAERAAPSFRPLLRVLTAAGLIFYGCAKITGAQFLVPQSEMDRPLRDVSGFWLTWYYFGHTLAYKYFIAMCEVSSGVLRLWRKTSLLAALVSSTLLVNVVVIDLVFRVDFGGTLAAGLLLVASLVIVSDYRNALVELLWRRVPDEDSRWLRTYRAAVAAGIVVAALGFNYWVANYNNRAPTPIDGTWEVVSPADTLVSTVYFERERAHLCVFVSRAGQHVWHDFEFAPGDSNMAIYERWLTPSSALLYRGHVQADGSILLRDDHTGGELTLRRRAASQ
jgi:hypothetical protein